MDLDRLPDATVEVSADGRLVAANRRAAELFGALGDRLDRDVVDALVLRDTHGSVVSLDDLVGDAPTACTATRSDGTDVEITVTGRRDTDGTAVLCARPMSDPDGIAVVSTVSHELRSPLTSVKGYVSLMLSRWDRIDDATKREMLTQVDADADRVTRLIGELLDISRLEAGRLVLRRELVDLAAVASTVVDKVRMSHPTVECTIDVGDVGRVYADPDKVAQVLTNLVENAAKYGSPTGMSITASVDDAMVAVAVHDRGPGIPEDDLAKVFTRFFRRDHGRPDGTGLGLWISRGLVEAHGGRLTAASAPGEGTTFTFTLPLDAFETAHR